MISSGIGYVSILLLIAAVIVFTEKRGTYRLFDYLPSIVILYFTVMLLSTLGLWHKTPEITATYKTLKSTLLPAMIFLMLLGADMRQIIKLGPKMLLTFLLASLSIAVGFAGMFFLFHTHFAADAWKPFAALAGSWMGGTGNMVAVQGALNVPDSAMGYALLIDSIDYAVWVMVLLALVPFASRFNRWTGADTSLIDEVGAKLAANDAQRGSIGFKSLFILLAASCVISALSSYLGGLLPTTAYLSHTTWTVILATLAGIIGAMTPLGRMGGSAQLGTAMLYFLVALIASRANFSELTQTPLYIVAGFVILAIHLLIMVLFAKLFRLDLFSLGVASLANIGGVASAPILASAYSRALIPIGVLMAMLGYIVGTFGGLGVGKVLEMIAG
jgi:uncharacterized membrane protein